MQAVEFELDISEKVLTRKLIILFIFIVDAISFYFLICFQFGEFPIDYAALLLVS